MVLTLKGIIGNGLVIGGVVATITGSMAGLPMCIFGYLLVVDDRIDKLEAVLGFTIQSVLNKDMSEVEEEIDNESKTDSKD